jgi:hypothetical protein
MNVRIPDLLSVQQADGRYIVRKGVAGAGTDDASFVTIDTSAIDNVDGDDVKAALESIDERLAALAGSLTAGDYPIVKNWKPRAMRLPSTEGARRVEFNDDPDTHIYEAMVFDSDAVNHAAIVKADLPLGFVPGNFALDFYFYTPTDGLTSADSTDIQVAWASIGTTDPINPSFSADQTLTLNYPGAANVKSVLSFLISSPGFAQQDTLSFRVRVLGADANDFPVHLMGLILRRL